MNKKLTKLLLEGIKQSKETIALIENENKRLNSFSIINPFELTKENDPRCAEYYAKAFPNLTKEKQDELRIIWVYNNVIK
jgi:flagellar assembly factor FliW